MHGIWASSGSLDRFKIRLEAAEEENLEYTEEFGAEAIKQVRERG
jgi:hypothetical protein